MNKKYAIAVLLAGTMLAGCGNNPEGETVPGTMAPEETAMPSPTAEISPTPEATVEPSPEQTAQNGAGEGAAGQTDYRAMLDEIEANMGDVEALYEEGSNASMREAAGEEFTRWDNALNEIYGELEARLSDSEMEALREEQREWIDMRDETAEREAAEFEGGTMQPLQQTMTMARLTKERCYELVEVYLS